jgi:hypothetical protein
MVLCELEFVIDQYGWKLEMQAIKNPHGNRHIYIP